jgi:CheY-like chemotaxis protein
MDMNSSLILRDKVILVVDDEPDVLDTVEDILDTCLVTKAKDFDSGRQFIMSFTYDLVILDIMGVDGFELLKMSVKRGFPTLILTAYALTPEALEMSIKLGAVGFLPKEKMGDIDEYLADIVICGYKPIWTKIFLKLNRLFKRRFGPDWKERNHFFSEFEKMLLKTKNHIGM